MHFDLAGNFGTAHTSTSSSPYFELRINPHGCLMDSTRARDVRQEVSWPGLSTKGFLKNHIYTPLGILSVYEGLESDKRVYSNMPVERWFRSLLDLTDQEFVH